MRKLYLSFKCFSAWKKYVGYNNCDKLNVDVNSPGHVNNSDLLEERVLAKMLVEELDYKLVTKECWKLILEWYDWQQILTQSQDQLLSMGF